MAEVAGAAQSGRPVAPSLIDGQQSQPGAPLPSAITADLHDLMRAVVTSGRATKLDDLPGGEVAGETGTAEYGTAKPPRCSHGWFAGYRGDLAFAVFVYDGRDIGRRGRDHAHVSGVAALNLGRPRGCPPATMTPTTNAAPGV